MIGQGALRAAAKLWYAKMLLDQEKIPVPRDSAEVISGAEDPDRVLLIGNGPTHGWGTVTHELALTGQLGRALTRRTQRPTDTRYVGNELMSLAGVIPWLGDQSLAAHDLVLLVLSMNDAVRLTPAHEYRRDMERLLTKVTEECKPSARIVVAGIQPVASLPHYRGMAARLAQRNADNLNAVTRELIGRFDGVQFMELHAPQPEPGRPYGSPQLYAEWSEWFADVCAPALDEARRLDVERQPIVIPGRDWQWQPAKRIIEEAPDHGHPELERLVTEARKVLGANVAYVSLIDGDRQFYAANTSPSARDVPLDLSICRVTMQGDETVVIDNTQRDERFKYSPLGDVVQARTYVGAPLKNEQGENIGTFCVQSVLPGGARVIPVEKFEAFVERAQAELQRIAADIPGRTDEAAAPTTTSTTPEDRTLA
jgi:lysophospholipase L1-like esterase